MQVKCMQTRAASSELGSRRGRLRFRARCSGGLCENGTALLCHGLCHRVRWYGVITYRRVASNSSRMTSG